jgi:plasmid stabilization system protein ParE
MADIIWTEPALQALNAIAEYIALDNPLAASRLVKQTFTHVERLENFPKSGRIPPELPDSVYREGGAAVSSFLSRRREPSVDTVCDER